MISAARLVAPLAPGDPALIVMFKQNHIDPYWCLHVHLKILKHTYPTCKIITAL